MSVTKIFSTREDDAVGNSDGLEGIQTNIWEGRERFVYGTAPVGEISICKRIDCWVGGHNVSFVIAGELTANFEVSEIGEGVNVGNCDVVVVLGEGEVKTSVGCSRGTLSGSGKLNGVVDQDIFTVIGLIGTLSFLLVKFSH